MLEIVRHMVADGPKTVGPFHHAVSAGDYHFITGQMPTLPDDSTKVVKGGIEEQTRRVMDNLALVLKGLDSGFDRVVFARVYLVNFQDFDRMNSVYTTYFEEGKLPSRTCIGVTGLAVGALVEVDLIAAR
ncbi:MAG: RidA family protein [Hyphomicrobiaceae bacterium TMED74]|nr:enamine deaminase RidA [Filomicrobium sp.]RPG36965.1 MAG: RidA family protein [Hyphomicrobiaceae bacterium TMED74]